ncbi:MAG: hypothetical protein RL754_1441 [Bacteroidota bacterium]
MTSLGALAFVGVNAQDSSTETQSIGVQIDAHALVDVVDPSMVFDFSGDDPTEAGNGMELGANATKTTYLNYSYMKANGALNTASVSVSLSGMNDGMTLSLLVDGSPAAALNSQANGTLGTVTAAFDATNGANSPVQLTSTNQTIIENIGTSFTGDGSGNGYQLRYVVDIVDYALLDADNGSQDVGTVTYTIAQ